MRPWWRWGNGWGWAAAGTLAAGSSYPYGYGIFDPYYSYNSYGSDSCLTVQRRVWDGYGYRTTWINSCTGY